MRKKSKSAAILAVIMAMTLAGSSAVYAEENPSAKTTETDDNERKTQGQQRMNLLHAMKVSMSL